LASVLEWTAATPLSCQRALRGDTLLDQTSLLELPASKLISLAFLGWFCLHFDLYSKCTLSYRQSSFEVDLVACSEKVCLITLVDSCWDFSFLAPAKGFLCTFWEALG